MMSARYCALAYVALLFMQNAQAASQAGSPEPGSAAIPSPYPADAIAAKHEGMVLVKVLVGSNGSVSHAQIDKSSGYSDLDEAAIKVVMQHHFTPHIGKNGKADSGYAIIPVKFALPPSKSS